MEKGTKLKLKRKLKDPQQNISEEIKRDGTGSNARSNAHVSPVNYSDSDSVDIEEFVVLTSESDGEEPQEKQKKTLQGIESEPEQSDRSKRYLLHYSLVNLLPQLR